MAHCAAPFTLSRDAQINNMEKPMKNMVSFLEKYAYQMFAVLLMMSLVTFLTSMFRACDEQAAQCRQNDPIVYRVSRRIAVTRCKISSEYHIVKDGVITDKRYIHDPRSEEWWNDEINATHSPF